MEAGGWDPGGWRMGGRWPFRDGLPFERARVGIARRQPDHGLSSTVAICEMIPTSVIKISPPPSDYFFWDTALGCALSAHFQVHDAEGGRAVMLDGNCIDLQSIT